MVSWLVPDPSVPSQHFTLCLLSISFQFPINNWALLHLCTSTTFPSNPRMLRLTWFPLRLITAIPPDVPRRLQTLLKIRWIIVCYWAPSHSWGDLISTVSAPCCVWLTSGVCHQGQLPFSLKELDALQLFSLTTTHTRLGTSIFVRTQPPKHTHRHTHSSCPGLTQQSPLIWVSMWWKCSVVEVCPPAQTVREDRRAQSGVHATVCSNI